MDRLRNLFGGLAAVVCIGAGIYMLSSRTESANSIFNVFLHGIGAYFIGKGIFIWIVTRSQVEQWHVQRTTLEFIAAAWARWTGEETRGSSD